MSDWSKTFGTNPDTLGRLLADTAAEFVCLATSHGEPFYLNPAGRHLVGLDENQPASAINLREFYAEESWNELRDTAGPAVNKSGRWQGRSRLRNVQTGQFVDVDTEMFRVKPERAGRSSCLMIVHREAGEQAASSGSPGRCPGAKAGHPGVLARSHHHDQPAGNHHRVQPGGRADLWPSAQQIPRHQALRRAVSRRDERRPTRPHRPLFGRRRGLLAGPAGGSDGGPRRRRDFRRRNGHDHQPRRRRSRA